MAKTKLKSKPVPKTAAGARKGVRGPSKKVTAKKVTAKKVTAKKATAKKATAKKAPPAKNPARRRSGGVPRSAAEPDRIVVHGARQHNLSIDVLEIPKRQLVVFTGVSGSGKSSLAFDTL
ncbi:MAG: excinuclease ABC subunit UvrA, partial [Nannocystaceae bacterium]|nr:excinuclease ABC subunit UvrA [Nannocystaceae bacterium]